MANRFVLHVLAADEGWKVAPRGDSQPYSYHATKSAAVAHARHLARQHTGGRVVVHARDGSVEAELVVSERSRGVG